MNKKGFTAFELMVSIVIGLIALLVVGWFIFVGYMGYNLFTETSQHGLKSVIERVWEGEGAK
jgi:prepilin-type N-terminal cleavage/methylation domain-containing protein